MPHTFYHFSAKRFLTIDTIGWNEQINGRKPRGLWLSDEDNDPENGWKAWCIDENFRLDHLRYKYAARLKPEAKILFLTTPEAIEQFTSEYKTDFLLDWPRLAQTHQGIMISPYQWAERMAPDTFWYYGWDCASGCIWDIEALESFEFHSETILSTQKQIESETRS